MLKSTEVQEKAQAQKEKLKRVGHHVTKRSRSKPRVLNPSDSISKSIRSLLLTVKKNPYQKLPASIEDLSKTWA